MKSNRITERKKNLFYGYSSSVNIYSNRWGSNTQHQYHQSTPTCSCVKQNVYNNGSITHLSSPEKQETEKKSSCFCKAKWCSLCNTALMQAVSVQLPFDCSCKTLAVSGERVKQENANTCKKPFLQRNPCNSIKKKPEGMEKLH